MDKYWLHEDGATVANYLLDYHSKWDVWNNSPFKQAWVRNFLAYYSPVINTVSWDTSLVFEGVQGELTRMYTPKARTLIRQLVSLTTKQRLAVQASAQVSGTDVIQEVKLANALSDQIIQNQRLDVKIDQLVEGALVCGNWFLKTCWRTDMGQPYTRDENGTLIFTGGVEITANSVFDVYYDITYPHWDQITWAECRTIKNKWDLIAQHPELEKEILALAPISEARGPNTWFERTLVDEDSVFVYEFYARPSPSLPKGRMVFYSDDKTIYYDGDNEYEGIPIEPMTPEMVMSCGLGYPIFSNIIASQEMFDNSLSAIATNQGQFAVQSVAVARGANINVQELNGMRFVSYTPQNVSGGGKPEALQLTQSSPETFKFIDVLNDIMNDLSGVNGALRGAPPPGVTSGTAIATLSANALEFTQSISKAFQQCFEKTMKHAITCYQKFAKLPQTVELKGKNNQVSHQDFVGDQIKNISGIKFITANPLMQTISGRLEIAEKLMAMPKDLWPSYVSILEGRPLSEIYKTELSSEDLIQMEDEQLMKGIDVPALATDDHAAHIVSHAGLMNDPAIRMNGPTIGTILAHIEQHKQLAQTTDPFLLGIIRTGKIPDMPPPSAPMGRGAPPTPGGLPANNTNQAAEPAQDALNRPGG
jgi:hypothetical protein